MAMDYCKFSSHVLFIVRHWIIPLMGVKRKPVLGLKPTQVSPLMQNI